MAVRNIRTITCQMIKALAKLKELAIIHADLKPENIMIVDHCRHPFSVKFYRSPEILLGLPFCEKVDMWSLGCVMSELFLGWPLYPGDSEFDQVRYICETQGLPQAHLLNMASKVHNFFKLTTNSRGENKWQLKPNKRRPPSGTEGRTQGKQLGSTDRRKYILSSLDQLETMEFTEHDPELRNEDVAAEVEDRRSMVQLLKRMLTLDSHQRILPNAALHHPFINMHHLRMYPDYNRYYEQSAQALREALIQDTAPEGDSCRSHHLNAERGQRFLYPREKEAHQSCPRVQNHHDHREGYPPSSEGLQGNNGVLSQQTPVPSVPQSPTALIEDLMESLCIVDEASLETTMGVWADKDVQCAFHPSSSVIPSDLQAGLQPSESIAFQETELDCPHLGSTSREETESGSMLSHFTRLCESQRLRQPVARSSRSDPTHRLSYTSVPQVDKAGEPIGFSFFSRDPTTQQDLAGPREQAGAKEAARDYGLEDIQFLNFEPEGYTCHCGQWWPAWTTDPEVSSYLGYGPPACCSHTQQQCLHY
ncbi:probable serine/threonine-protein kinase dyrk1 [Oncorhynchus keta]|uniref:probable serine/threonine-protein kinase dyrk1 n=1 Tax=Oncorhynchus keta TaxID=8018 RepID=UPI00227C6537|nr:probable serine/threonine-protein kinase dyrk1 [Oncorhynchus keta]